MNMSKYRGVWTWLSKSEKYLANSGSNFVVVLVETVSRKLSTAQYDLHITHYW